MTDNTIHLDPSQVPAQLRALHPGTRKFKLVPTDTVTIPADAGIWSGGSRSTYQAVRLEDGKLLNLTDHVSAPWDPGRQDRTAAIRPGLAVIKHSIFQGTDMGLTFYVHPSNVATLLPTGTDTAQLTPAERFVLYATRTYKSSYNGQTRYQIAASDVRHGYNLVDLFPYRVPPTPAEIETAITSLITHGYLTKSRAITPKGRNVK